ncbi:MAG: hypothetical protein WDN69_35280 [Aliidongia sp.]
MVRKQDASDVGGRVDLRPMTGLKDVKGGTPGLGSHVFGDANVQIGVGLAPNEEKRNLGAPELKQTGRIGSDLMVS